MKGYYKFLFILALATILLTNCKKENKQLCDPTPVFNPDVFISKIDSSLNSQSIIGYQYAINVNGNLYHDTIKGRSRHTTDPGGPLDLTSNHRFNVASISKFIGSIALLNALEDNNISIDFAMSDYLPPSWNSQIHLGNKSLTFKDILSNETGINFPGSTPRPGDMPTEAEMLQGLSSTPVPSRVGVYQNGNFTLIRVLIGEIVFNLDETATNYATECTNKYFEYLNTKIFSKLNLNCPKSASDAIAYYATSSYPWAYQYPFDSTFTSPTSGLVGWAHSNSPYRNGGSAGLLLSSLDIAKIMAYFKHDNSELIISKIRRDLILEHELGLTESINGKYGRYQSKGGTRGPDDCCDRSIRSRIMFFPNDVEVVILTNSDHNSLHNLLRDAFDNSWINPCL